MNAVIAEDGLERRLEETLAKDIMTKNIMPAYADWSVKDLAEFLVSNGISGAPVVDDAERLLGVVSVTDVARHASIAEDEAEVRGPHDVYTDALDFSFDEDLINEFQEDAEGLTTVRDIMTPMVHDISAKCSVMDASREMLRNRIHRVFVSQDGKIVGVISALDFLAALQG